MQVDSISIKGSVELVLRDSRGRYKARRKVNNLITTVGKNGIADALLAARSGSPVYANPTHMAVGTGSTGALVGDTILGAESARVALTSKTRVTNVVTLVGDWAAGVGTATLQEAGLFDGATAGAVNSNMYSRAVYTSIVKGANDTLKITWTYTIG